MRIWSETRRTLTWDETERAQYLGNEWVPPWMETGYILTHVCGFRLWEYHGFDGVCPKCHNKGGDNGYWAQKPNWYEKLIHWYKVDRKLSVKQQAKVMKNGQEG